MRIKGRTDSNQQEVVKALRKIPGVSVAITSVMGSGFVDIICGYKNTNYMIELKDGNKTASRRKLTPDEEKFMAEWKGQYAVCKDLDEILVVLNINQ